MHPREQVPLLKPHSSQAHVTKILRNEMPATELDANALEWMPPVIMSKIIRYLSFLDVVSLTATSYQLKKTLLSCDATFHLSWPSGPSNDAEVYQSSPLRKPTVRDMIKSFYEITATEAAPAISQMMPAEYYNMSPPSYLHVPYQVERFINFYLHAKGDILKEAPLLARNIVQSDCSSQLLKKLSECECYAGCLLCTGGCISETVNFCATWGDVNPMGHVTNYSCWGWNFCYPPTYSAYSCACAANWSCGCANHCDGLYHGVACLSQQGCFNCVGLLGIAMCGLAAITCLLSGGLTRLEGNTRLLMEKLNEIEDQRSKLNEIISGQPVISLLFEKTKKRLEEEQLKNNLQHDRATSSTSPSL